jgi:rhodanese-related sulfurtransferase
MTLLTVTPREVRQDWIARREIALLDLREEDPFARAHPLFASQLPLSRLELEILDRVPRKDAKIVLYDNGEGLVSPAGKRLTALGYTQIRALAGGLQGWKDAGYELFQDVNSYSQAFGELVEARRHTPSLPAQEVQARIDQGADQVILDSRRFEEYAVMNIPGGINTPGAELVLRAREIAPDPATTIIVNCAGRTRSLIGAQSLLNAGVPNPVFALRNGTIGWTLAQQTLEHGQGRRFPAVSDQTLEEARAKARDVAYRAGVRRIDAEGLADLATDRKRTLYLFDVRTPDEYAAGHLPGFRSAPGGQLVQETDVFAPVRGGRIVLADDLGPRADMSASWLAQLGWDVYVLDGGFDAELEVGARRPAAPTIPTVETISPEDLAVALGDGAVVVLDLAPSPLHRKGHVPGAWFAIRARLAEAFERIPEGLPIVLTSPDGRLARLAAAEVEEISDHPVRVLDGGTEAWATTGRRLDTGLARAASDPEDVYKRPYEGTDNAAEAMQAYLDWEFGLVDQLARDGSHGFFVI